MFRLRYFLPFISIILLGNIASAAIKYVRWESSQTQLTDNLEEIVPALNAETGLQLSTADFELIEDRALATSHFKNYVQKTAGVVVKGAMIRSWAHPESRRLIQMEAHLDDGALDEIRLSLLRLRKLTTSNLRARFAALNNTLYVNRVVLAHPSDNRVGAIETSDEWHGTDLVRVIKVTGRRGVHTIVVSHFTAQIQSAHYVEHPQFEIPALVYPIYEETEKTKRRQDRVQVTLKNLLDTRRLVEQDPYAPLRTRRYFEDKIHPVLGETEHGREQGYWSSNWLVRQARALFAELPSTANRFENGGLVLVGQYASVNIHPDAVEKLSGINFTPNFSGQLALTWRESNDTGSSRWEVVPKGAYFGRPLSSLEDALSRPARRLADHDTVTYLNDGFDEIQVYYAIDRLMESLHGMGFSDPELSTRPFHAFLYDPDISMRDNAYYTNDTINFTTYSPEALNYARDNSTIWHELGHGVMDRLMGDLIVLNDSGGLSEGMADFVAQLVIQEVTGGNPFDGSTEFRIINKIGFSLTNESHDDGEAYGGAMNDILQLAIAKWGRAGLAKMTDLTLESMRLARNHPGLTANDWFEHMIYADQLGRENVRASGEFHDLIVRALQTRNFRLDRGPIADFMVQFDGDLLTDKSLGSRYNPISHMLSGADEAAHELAFNLVPSEHYEFKFPIRVVVEFNDGPLQGAVKWKNESAGAQTLVLNSVADVAKLAVGATAGCDRVNREDGSCSDFAYIKVFNSGDDRPFAKKRFYLRIVAPAL